jgi:hypothetical protein
MQHQEAYYYYLLPCVYPYAVFCLSCATKRREERVVVVKEEKRVEEEARVAFFSPFLCFSLLLLFSVGLSALS